jgi:hypothetical protein
MVSQNLVGLVKSHSNAYQNQVQSRPFEVWAFEQACICIIRKFRCNTCVRTNTDNRRKLFSVQPNRKWFWSAIGPGSCRAHVIHFKWLSRRPYLWSRHKHRIWRCELWISSTKVVTHFWLVFIRLRRWSNWRVWLTRTGIWNSFWRSKTMNN